jgi:NADPH:quinone reductase-like Zn-dependent oxidoreductase
MQAIQMQAFGLDALVLTELPVPKLGAGQVLVNITAFSLNYLDLMVIRGDYNPHLALPHIPGSDAAGVVTAVGKGVSTCKPGDRVTTTFVQQWLSGAVTAEFLASRLGCERPGVFAQYVVLPTYGLVPTPPHLSDQEAATLPIAGLTAWVGLMEHAGLQPGQTVLVQGTGGMSVFALQFAKASGCRVIATSGSDQKLETMKALGADALINYRATPLWEEEVLRLTEGRGADLTLDVAGEHTVNQSMRAVKLGGFVGLVGFLSGLRLEFDLFTAIVGNKTLKGYSVGSRESFAAMNQALTTNGIRPVIDRVFPASQVREAFEYLESGKHLGKVVLTF